MSYDTKVGYLWTEKKKKKNTEACSIYLHCLNNTPRKWRLIWVAAINLVVELNVVVCL